MSKNNPRDLEGKVAENLRTLRLTAGLSQNQVAAKSGMTQQLINKLETGQVRITAGRLHKLAKALSQPHAAFFVGLE